MALLSTEVLGLPVGDDSDDGCGVTDLLLPTTDAGVAIQVGLVLVGSAVALRLSWQRPDTRLLVLGVSLTLFALLGLRAAH